MGAALPADRIKAAFGVVRCWQQAPDAVAACPVCSAPGLVIVDCSARPFVEWYALSCNRCGLDATISVPLSPPNPSSN
jgi:hypothetical protein